MRVEAFSWLGQESALAPSPSADLVLYFAGRSAMQAGCHQQLHRHFPHATLVGCSSGGHALGDEIADDGGVGVAVRFDATRLRLVQQDGTTPANSHASGRHLGEQLAGPGLAGVLLLSDGLHVNGSALAAGIAEALGPDIPVSGGLAGDGAAFGQTLIGAGDAAPAERRIAAIGFYGDAIRFGHGSAGGWERFGPERRITRAEGTVLHELDGAAALDLYERYLGDEAAGLPSTALLYPLRIWDPRDPEGAVVRTVLGVDREARSMTFAGDMPNGWKAQLMRGGTDRLAMGAAEAGRMAAERCPTEAHDSLAILVSCIGRRLLMGQRTGEEIEAAAAQFAPGMPVITFYSYGEVSPQHGRACELHNQTMTITLLREAA